ncbi:MAG: DUF1820 family protein [Acidobacteriota bacterium]|nr:DUF1820 family protein [Acidobacteriota bacterium]MXZ39453.1 DUF1820 family protein [Holophagales bacterium]MDE2922636.1 DUF1820 family protein [Acidobacteriota bacterium]MDE3265593.1 DUF1820 family protein [Acidobacteriota bacterium]MYF05129.1 DUF1820 family protein [Holophagales bacterium]
MSDDLIYRVTFLSQGEIYEVYARSVSQGGLLGFVEIGELVFGERTQVVVDPSEERLQREFKGVRRTYLPMHSVLRIDQVTKQGTARIRDVERPESRKVTPFPMPIYTPGGETK